MAQTNKFEKQFFNALHEIFVGAKVEGDSGYVNLMGIKSRYYERGVFPQLQKDITAALQPFPDFREELFDKLYTFFQRYFSESGSIYFRYTALHQNVYEKVYTDDRDVILFWKTHMLYYVKTDRIFTSLNVEVDGVKFFFDASKMTLKKSNEKREVIYAFRKVHPEDGTLVFDVAYSEKGRTTKVDDILNDLKKAGVKLSDETLYKAFRVFEKQSEVDYFINKNARAFLQEQFDLWLYQYLFAGQNVWSEARLAQLQVLKAIAYKVIDFISQFEDELVKIWNKPKFVRNSHYVLTLDHILAAPAPSVIASPAPSVIASPAGAKQSSPAEDEIASGTDRPRNDILVRLLSHPNLPQQVQEWRDLGMIGEDFKLEMLTQKDADGAPLHPQFQYLPMDTKFFPDLELDILARFDDLDAALDGRVIHSENYQALNTISSKYANRIDCIHIDPPYNTSSSGFYYENKFSHSSWLSMMFDRASLSFFLLKEKGVFICHIDEYELERLNLVFDQIGFDNSGIMIWDRGAPVTGAYGLATQHEYAVWRTKGAKKISKKKTNLEEIIAKAKTTFNKYGGATDQALKEFRSWLRNNPTLSDAEKTYNTIDELGRVYRSDNMSATDNRVDKKFHTPLIHPITNLPCPVPNYGWRYTPDTLKELLKRDEILFGPDHHIMPRKKTYLEESESSQVTSMYRSGERGKKQLDELGIAFPFAHGTNFYKHLISSGFSESEGIILDFFAGSGTTAHAVMNLNRADGGKRKYILVELGEHFHTVILPRIKKVAFSDKWKDGKANGGQGMSHFVKYYDLEQYEDVLRRAHYADADLFHNPYEDPYHSYVFLRDLKLLDSIEIDTEQNKAHFYPERLYSDIDLAETLSQRRGKWIKRITAEYVEFQDGERMSLTDPDWQVIKPLVWW